MVIKPANRNTRLGHTLTPSNHTNGSPPWANEAFMAQLIPTTVAITVSNSAAAPISQNFAARASAGSVEVNAS